MLTSEMNVPGADSKLTELVAVVDGLDPTAAQVLRAAVAQFFAPICVQVAGRAGVGRTSVVSVLARGGIDAVETSGIDVPGAADPNLDGDVVVYVLVDSVRAADAAALIVVGPTAIAVLNKTDALAGAAIERVAECEAQLGIPILPLIATGDASASGVDALSKTVRTRIERIRAGRGTGLMRTLEAQAARSRARDHIEEYVRSDDAVAIASAAARARGDVESLAVGAPAEPSTPEEALHCAVWWESRSSEALTAHQRRAILDIRRGYVRDWSRLRSPEPPGVW